MTILKKAVLAVLLQACIYSNVQAVDVLAGLSLERELLDYDTPVAEDDATLIKYGVDTVIAQDEYFGKLSFFESVSNSAEDRDSDTQHRYYRSDADLSLGYIIGHGFSAFLGYHHGKTRLDQSDFKGVQGNSLTLRQKGPYIGGSYTYPVGKHAVSVSMAYADMDTEVNVKRLATESVFDSDGDTTGLSYSLKLSGPMNETMSYGVTVKSTSYEVEDDKLRYQGEVASFDEDHVSVIISVNNAF